MKKVRFYTNGTPPVAVEFEASSSHDVEVEVYSNTEDHTINVTSPAGTVAYEHIGNEKKPPKS